MIAPQTIVFQSAQHKYNSSNPYFSLVTKQFRLFLCQMPNARIFIVFFF